MIRKGLKPGIKFGMERLDERLGFRRVLPFRRSWIAIGILLAMDIAFIIPAVLTFQQAASGWGKLDSLFDVVATVFLSAWLLGWSLAPLIMTAILSILLFGREVLRARPGFVEIFIGLPVFGVTARYDIAKVRNLRIEKPASKSGKSWRGSHVGFDYGANTVGVGSNISDAELAEIKSSIEMASGSTIRRGEARPEDLQPKWEPEEQVALAAKAEETAVEATPVTLASPSTLALIIANLVPVAGTVFFSWQLSDVMVLYWAESAVIGFFNICKMVVIGRWLALLAGPFFLGHFGGFMAVHFLFIDMFFVKGIQGGSDSGGELAEVGLLFISLWPALLALFASHAYSFVHNFLGRHEYRERTMKQQMSEPYSRIIFMHLVIIFGGGMSMVLGQTTLVLIIVIALKIYFDVKAHLKQRASS